MTELAVGPEGWLWWGLTPGRVRLELVGPRSILACDVELVAGEELVVDFPPAAAV